MIVKLLLFLLMATGYAIASFFCQPLHYQALTKKIVTDIYFVHPESLLPIDLHKTTLPKTLLSDHATDEYDYRMNSMNWDGNFDGV